VNSKLLHEAGGARTFALVLDTGDEAMKSLSSFANEYDLDAAGFTAIGAFSRAVVAYFDLDEKDYAPIPVDEQVEVLSIVGHVTREPGGRNVHAHAVLGKRDGTALGGHLIEGHVRPTLEIVLTESPAHLRRTKDDATGLALIDLGHDDKN
jgi:predicted DNA-binding protein with PD1-like motif